SRFSMRTEYFTINSDPYSLIVSKESSTIVPVLVSKPHPNSFWSRWYWRAFELLRKNRRESSTSSPISASTWRGRTSANFHSSVKAFSIRFRSGGRLKTFSQKDLRSGCPPDWDAVL